MLLLPHLQSTVDEMVFVELSLVGVGTVLYLRIFRAKGSGLETCSFPSL